MDANTDGSTDASSIKPVSSLRSHFENMLGSNNKPSAPPTPRVPTPKTPERLGVPENPRRADGRISLDIPRETSGAVSTSNLTEGGANGSTTPRGRADLRPPWVTPKARPSSMMSFGAARSQTRSPPKLTIHSPRSPPKSAERPIHSPLPSRAYSHAVLDSPAVQSPSIILGKPFVPSRNGTPSSESRQAPPIPVASKPSPHGDPDKNTTSVAPTSPIPPPVNRAGKPKISGTTKVNPPDSPIRKSLPPDSRTEASDIGVSPFDTPPSRGTGSVRGSMSPRNIAETEMGATQRISSRDSYLPPRPNSRAVAERTMALDSRLGFQPQKRSQVTLNRGHSDLAEDKPGLPPRRDEGWLRKSMVLPRAAPIEPPVRHSMDTVRPPLSVSETNNRFKPPPRRTQTLDLPERTSARSLEPPRPPPPRNSGEMKRPSHSNIKASPRSSGEFPRPTTRTPPRSSGETGSQKIQSARTSGDLRTYDSDDADVPLDKSAPILTDYPDSSEANRRPPIFREGPREIPTKYDTKLFAICGEYICTSGYVTRVWSLLNGEMLMSLSHGDTVKATAICFRPATDVENEGKRLWVGTNLGEMHEIDIPTQSVVYTKSKAHRSPLTKIFRYASEMWSLDEEGVLHIWQPDESGSPTLHPTPFTYRVPRGHSFSMIAGSQLWVAYGKEIRVYQRSSDNRFFQEATTNALSQPNAGDVTSGAILSSQPDRIYFGHVDGKVSIYAKRGFACLGVVNVSLYKISSLVGVGDYIWAGYITGMIYVYDTRSTPWKVMKDWKGHENSIAGILADRTSMWKLNRLQVASLGTDNMLCIWDGMLRDDWLETQMHQKDVEYCDFREISATVMTWNAGAAKPKALRHDNQDENFFRDLLQPQDPSDVLVFGFQELVDLEDKKVTAKSFFKKKKKNATSPHEHMSHQYRAWRDYLQRIISEYLPSERYTLLHTAELVGLFTCIFVKDSEMSRIRDVSAAQVKLGMGGLHGNKGALIVRFFMDDSSVCFINCHLAAGQTQTMHRNNDVATIMEASALPPNRSPSDCAAFFVGGGDGSMILDHEICILNGDLNYRIDAMPRNTVIDAVNQGNLKKLLERDQLLVSKKRNPGFRLRAFHEAPITFAPTYKYDVGTDTYDTSEKKRSPAWCDRLLYRGVGRIKQIDYRRHDGVRVSDHRPVSGRFKIRVKTINTKRQMATRERCEAEFEQVKQRVAKDIKHDYLCNVFGLSPKEAEQLLKKG
ncbi:DNase I-like protein [Westerdykella ornata]|uniref:DNase I-like protein n=1 Tax=Westerdykella ornata TaxID=318751 RepID=A0A6A6JUN9_WESOR|nr:DNase I-like protein [Westerdykella ornata]KAF2279934.1 DNase I-like protein [Westerdykella ornata]